MNNIAKQIILTAFALAILNTQDALAVVNLPDPTSTYDGLPVAVQYDDFVSYSTQLLTQFGFAGFNGAAGVGGLDVVLLTQAGGIDNDPVSGGFTFEDPVDSVSGGCPGCSTFVGTWGAGNSDHGPVLVDDLLDYLHFNFGANNNIPVFTFDMVEPGSDPNLDLLSNFVVYDPNTNSEIASWSLDAINNGTFDPTAFITVNNHLEFTGTSLTEYSFTNTGSGKYDFLVYAPSMNLAIYAGQGYEFHIFSQFKNIQGGGEEAFISGAITSPVGPNEDPNTPEPTTMGLVSLGLLAAGIRRFRKSK